MSAVSTVFFEPLDVLFFRDHRPFDAGLHSFGRSTFPQPSVIRGALRTALFLASGARFDSHEPGFGAPEPWVTPVLGGRKSPGSLSVRGPFLARGGAGGAGLQPLLAMPADLDVRELDPPPGRAGAGSPAAARERELVRSNPLDMGALPAPRPVRLHRWRTGGEAPLAEWGGSLPWSPVAAGKGGGAAYLAGEGIGWYLGGEDERRTMNPGEGWVVREGEALEYEERIGIQRDAATLVVQEGMLYATRCLSFRRGFGLAAEVDWEATAAGEGVGLEGVEAARRRLHELSGSTISLGGKGHRARVHVREGGVIPRGRGAGEAGTRLRAWLLTPTPFRNGEGGVPEVLVPGRGTGLVSIAAGRPVATGGFDMAGGRPRPLRPALPAGSVLHFDWTEGGNLEMWWTKALADEDRRTGFGVALTGAWRESR